MAGLNWEGGCSLSEHPSVGLRAPRSPQLLAARPGAPEDLTEAPGDLASPWDSADPSGQAGLWGAAPHPPHEAPWRRDCRRFPPGFVEERGDPDLFLKNIILILFAQGPQIFSLFLFNIFFSIS